MLLKVRNDVLCIFFSVYLFFCVSTLAVAFKLLKLRFLINDPSRHLYQICSGVLKGKIH